MTPPRTYAEWASALDRVSKPEDEEAAIACLEAGTLDWSSGVAERATTALQNALESRLRQNAEILQRDLNRGMGRQEALVAALLAARRRYVFALRLARLPAFPDYVRDSFTKSVRESVANAQRSLEEGAARDRSGVTASVIRNNPLDPDRAPKPAAPSTPSAASGAPTGRRVILP